MNAGTVGVAKTAPYFLEERPDVQAMIDPRGKRILDVGCAGGALGLALRRAGASEIVGIEALPEVAAEARRKLHHVLVADAESLELPFDDEAFDCIIFADVLEHARDPWAMLAAFRRYLKANGQIVASIPNFRFYAVIARLVFDRWRYAESGILDRTHLRFFTLPTIREMFSGAGYRIERVQPTYRLFEDQSDIGRVGALLSRWFCRFVAPVVGRHFFTFQYLVVATKAP